MRIDPPGNPTEFWQVQNGDGSAGANDNSVQSFFASDTDALTLTPGTYKFEAMLAHATGATSTFMNFLMGGSATFSGLYDFYGTRISVSSGSPTGLGLGGFNNVFTASPVTNTAGNSGVCLKLKGIIRVTVGGTIIPQYSYNAATGSGPVLKSGSFFKVRKISDSPTAQALGPWG